MNKINTKHIIFLQAILFMIFLVMTSYFNRFAVDDYHFIGELRDSSFSEMYKQLYFQWHGRWTSNFLLVYLIRFYQMPFFLMLYNLFSFGLLYIGIVRLMNSVNNFYLLGQDKKNGYIYAGIFVSVLFFCTVFPGETWFWYTSSVVYFWSIIALFFGMRSFFTSSKKITDLIIFGLSAIYIGGANDPLALLIIIVLVWQLIKKKHIGLSIASVILVGGSFLINYLSPGTAYRNEITPNLSLTNLVLYTGYGTIKYLLFSIHKTCFPALLLSIPFYILGKNITNNISRNFRPVKELIVGILLIFMVTVFNQFVVIYALGSLPPGRSGIASSVFISIIVVRYVFLLGSYHQNHYAKVKHLLIFNVVALIVFNGYFFNVHRKYAHANDQRIDEICNSEDHLIIVEPLPCSGYLYNAEITSDADNYKNQHLKNGLGIKGNAIIKD